MAKRTRFDEKAIAKIAPTDKPQIIEDQTLPGFALRVQPTGRKVWVLRYKTPAGQRTTKTLGIFPVYSYSMALERAKAILRGEDPDPKPGPEPVKPMTFGEYLKEHYQPYLEAHSASPHEQRQRLNRFKLEDKALSDIRLGDVETWRTKRRTEGRKPSTINRDTNALRASLQRAVEWELLDANPLARLKPLKVDKQPVVRYLSAKEETRLLDALKARDDRMRAERASGNEWRRERGHELLPELGTYGDNLTPLVVLALNTGLRRGELWNLVWGDVDLQRKVLTVQGEGAKSGQTRHVPLNDRAVAVLKTHRGDVRPLKHVPVFGRHEFKKAFAGLLDDAKIERFRFHDTRHHFASKLVMAGVPLNTVRELLGHSDIKMTQRYAHLAPDNLRAAVDLLGGAS